MHEYAELNTNLNVHIYIYIYIISVKCLYKGGLCLTKISAWGGGRGLSAIESVTLADTCLSFRLKQLLSHHIYIVS